MHTPQDHKLRCHQSKKCILFGIGLIVICTFTYAVAMWLPEDRGELVKIIIIKIVYTLMKSIPWTLIVTLNFLMLAKISFLLYKRRITVNPEVQNMSRHNSFRCRTLLRQFTLSLILQTVLFICPSMHIYPVEFVALIFKKYGSKLNDIYSSMRVVLVVLNPAMFSIILQSKYNIVKTCRLEMRRASTAVRNMLDGSVLKNAQKNDTSQDKNLQMKSYLVNSTSKHLNQHNMFTVFPPTLTSPSTPNSHKSFVFDDSLVDVISVNSLKSFQDRGDANSFFCPKRFIERLNTTPSVDLSIQNIKSSMHSRTDDQHKSPSVEKVENLPPLVTENTSGSLPDVLQHGSTLSCFEQVNCIDRKSSLSRMNSDRAEEKHLPGTFEYKHANDKPLSDSSGDTLSEYDLAEALKFL
ncbi:unnamed protein product [Mytilus edulis]|uniref:Uncharacterized protein n=1 Tax=Mytilus edulis TaxID=6550 RepID=A0A8S3RLN1_MYTED|nr:unnamed protein product [Mytilus edulis]